MLANDITLIRTSDHDPAAQRALQRSARTGTLHRLRPGVLVDPEHLRALSDRERHVLLVRASLPHIAPGWVLSGLSAAAVYRWAHIGRWPEHVIVSDPTVSRTITTRWFVRRGSARHPPALGRGHFHGVSVTSGTQTVVDLAATLPFAEGLVVADALVRRSPSDLPHLPELVARVDPRNRRRIDRVLENASTAAESPAESLCRARFIEVRAPDFVEQQVFHLSDGRSARVDFWFPDAGVIVEVDGRAKYEDPTMLRGTTPSDTLWREKLREDELRARPEVRGFVRLTWADLMDLDRLRSKLRAAGIRCG